MRIQDVIATLPHHLLPHHTVSGWLGKLTHCQNAWVKNGLVRLFCALYRVDLAEAAAPSATAYPSFNAFFTRALRPEARPLTTAANAVASPADGVVSQLGAVTGGQIVQAKGQMFTAGALLGDADRAAAFAGGVFMTIYLSPRDYHRLHMPVAGTLTEMAHIPGRLFSVNAAAANTVPGLYARNERVVAVFDTAVGPMALVLVGAIFVCGIETVWHGRVTPPTADAPRRWRYAEDAPRLAMGEEMGRFNMGSTVIVLFGNPAVRWLPSLEAGQAVKMGALIGQHPSPPAPPAPKRRGLYALFNR